MLALFPLLLLGGAAWWGLAEPGGPPPGSPTPAVGLGGYLQGVVGNLANDPTTARQGLLSALVDDPDNLTLRARAMEAALLAGDTEGARRLAQTLPPAQLPPLGQLLQLTHAMAEADARGIRERVAQLNQTGLKLPLGTVWEAYVAADQGLSPGPLARQLEGSLPGWSGRWHAARLWRAAGEDAKARTLLEPLVRQHPGAILPLLDLLPLLPASERAAPSAAFAAANPTLAPLLQAPALPVGLQPGGLANQATAALLEFALQVWAEEAPGLAQQLLHMATLLPTTDPWLQQLRTYYQATVADTLDQAALARAGYQALASRPDGFGLLAQLRLHELQAQSAPTAQARRRALRAGEALAAQHPHSALAWQSVVALAHAAEAYTTAAQAATRLLALLPSAPSATLATRQAELYFTRGASWAMARHNAKAEADLQQAINLNPAHAEALNYLGYMWVDEGRNLEAAYSLLKRAHLLAPNNGAITDSVGWAYYRKGDYDTARQYLELAAQQEPGTPEILSHLADTYAQLGQLEEARKLWRRALDFANQGAQVPSAAFRRELERKVRQGRLE